MEEYGPSAHCGAGAPRGRGQLEPGQPRLGRCALCRRLRQSHGLIPDLVCGPEAIKLSIAFYRTAFPDLQIAIDELTAKRDAVLLCWTARSSTPLVGRSFTATQDVLMGTMICRCAHGQIAESWMHWDQAGVLERLGLRDGKEPPGSVPTPSGLCQE